MLPSFLLSIQLLVWQGQAMCCEPNKKKGGRGRDRMVVVFTITGAISA
jgi:hypothetical protein